MTVERAPAPAPLPAPTTTAATEVAEAAPAATPPEPAPAFAVQPGTIVALSGDRLSGIDRLLAKADELPVPPAPRPRFEAPAKPTRTWLESTPDEAAGEARKAAATKRAVQLKQAIIKQAAADKAAATKRAVEVKQAAADKAEREAIGIAGTNWVQLAGGAHADRMSIEFARLAAKSALLKRRGGAVSAGKDYFRLLTGPFDSKAAAQQFVNQLARDGVSGFSWTRVPATLRIEKLGSR
jgi:SPOR domain